MQIPKLIYGTAWKEERTSDLVVKAINAGFRGIDTAAQPRHYNEKGVGDALQKLRIQGIKREDLFLQTKFSPFAGQDPKRIPYDPQAPSATQVAQSFASSQKNLGTSYVDSLVLHSPLPWEQMTEVWKAMEKLHEQGGATVLGISNCYDLRILQALHSSATVKPKVLQNRFYAETSYDLQIREWCKGNEVTYQSFWTLTANPQILNSQTLKSIAQKHHKTEAQVFFRFLNHLGISPLTGTCSELHMKEDLEIFEFELETSEVEAIQALLLAQEH